MHVRELTRRKYRAGEEVTVRGPEDVVRILGKMRRFRKEHFVVLLMNARHVCISVETISIGTLNASLVHPRLCAATHKRGYVVAVVMWCSAWIC